MTYIDKERAAAIEAFTTAVDAAMQLRARYEARRGVTLTRKDFTEVLNDNTDLSPDAVAKLVQIVFEMRN